MLQRFNFLTFQPFNAPFVSLRGLNLLLAALAALLLAACSRNDDSDIRVEHDPKEAAPVPATFAAQPDTSTPASADSFPPGHPPIAATPGAPAMSSMSGGSSMTALPGMAEFTAATPTPKWSPPADWVADPPNPVRKGSWTVPASNGTAPAEVSVNVFAGQLGGLLANVNRWRGQVGLEPTLTDDTLPTCVANITIGGLPAQLVTLDGPDGHSLEGAFVFLPDRVWSFRLTGPTAAVTAQRPAFRAFLDSIQWPQ
jgi:hypothetical protein